MCVCASKQPPLKPLDTPLVYATQVTAEATIVVDGTAIRRLRFCPRGFAHGWVSARTHRAGTQLMRQAERVRLNVDDDEDYDLTKSMTSSHALIASSDGHYPLSTIHNTIMYEDEDHEKTS